MDSKVISNFVTKIKELNLEWCMSQVRFTTVMHYTYLKKFQCVRLTHFNSIQFTSSICYKSIDIFRNMCKIKYQNDTRKLILIFYIVYTIELVFSLIN